MATQLEHLRRTLATLDAEGVSSTDNPFRRGIQAQIALHERRLWREANGGWWGAESKPYLDMPCVLGRK